MKGARERGARGAIGPSHRGTRVRAATERGLLERAHYVRAADALGVRKASVASRTRAGVTRRYSKRDAGERSAA